MNQITNFKCDIQKNQTQQISHTQFFNLIQKIQTIDQSKRITKIYQKGQPNKVIIGRRNAIGRIPSCIQKQIYENFKNYGEKTLLQSTIIQNFQMLQEFFQTKFQRRLLYRASQNNFSVKTFHQTCDGFPNTLVICKTQASNIIGGFTPLTWDCQYEITDSYFKTDPHNQTFLFSITEHQKYIIKKSNRNKAICCYQKFGPTFGGGYDLLIGDNSAIQQTSTSNFPGNFQCQGKNQQQKNIRFTGCKKKNFKIKQWQVFQLKFSQKKQLDQTIRKIKLLNMEYIDINMKKSKKPSKISKIKQFVSHFLHFKQK